MANESVITVGINLQATRRPLQTFRRGYSSCRRSFSLILSLVARSWLPLVFVGNRSFPIGSDSIELMPIT